MKNRVLTDEGFVNFDAANGAAKAESVNDKQKIADLEAQVKELKHKYQSADALITKCNEQEKHIAALEKAQKEMEKHIKKADAEVLKLQKEIEELTSPDGK